MPESAILSGPQASNERPLKQATVALHQVSSQAAGHQVLQERASAGGGRAALPINESFVARMQDAPDAIRLIFDDFQRGTDVGGSGGGSGSRDDNLRLALQKKRWIEMQLHEVIFILRCLRVRWCLISRVACQDKCVSEKYSSTR
jgi:hypothetical protein